MPLRDVELGRGQGASESVAAVIYGKCAVPRSDVVNGSRNRLGSPPLTGGQSRTRGTAMNWDQIQGNWKQFKGKVQQQWGFAYR